jgi:hypothetical protein
MTDSEQASSDNLSRKGKTLYDVLGVLPSASSQEIRRAFRRRALQLHPDVNPQPDATERFKELNRAYQTLSDPYSRARYDRSGFVRPQPNTSRQSRRGYRPSTTKAYQEQASSSSGRQESRRQSTYSSYRRQHAYDHNRSYWRSRWKDERNRYRESPPPRRGWLNKDFNVEGWALQILLGFTVLTAVSSIFVGWCILPLVLPIGVLLGGFLPVVDSRRRPSVGMVITAAFAIAVPIFACMTGEWLVSLPFYEPLYFFMATLWLVAAIVTCILGYRWTLLQNNPDMYARE